jgi:hypothetical protein
MSERTTTAPMDADQTAIFAEACASITTSAFAGLSERVKQTTLAILARGGNLYVHAQMVPEFIVVLALDTGDPNVPNMELARWSGATPEAVKRTLN